MIGKQKTKKKLYEKTKDEWRLFFSFNWQGPGGSANAQGGGGDNKEKRRKESILDLSKYLEKTIRVKFAGGREAAGVLKGYDPLLNLVLDNTTEFLRDSEEFKIAEDTRNLGLVVCRGTSVVLICPQDGMESIQNPFISQDAWNNIFTVFIHIFIVSNSN